MTKMFKIWGDVLDDIRRKNFPGKWKNKYPAMKKLHVQLCYHPHLEVVIFEVLYKTELFFGMVQVFNC